MKRYFIISITILFFLILMSTAVMAADEKGLVYYLCPNQFDEMQTSAAVMIKDAVERAGYTCKVVSAANEDANLQMNQFDDAISQNPKAIIIAAVDGIAACAGVDNARNAGIPVIAFDRIISKTTVDFTSVAGCKRMGIAAAQETVNLLKKKYGEVKGSVLDIMGDPSDSYTVLIEEGFQETMKDYPNVKIATKIAEKWEASKAGDIADDFLLVYPETDLIFTHADHLAAAVVSILQTKGYAKNDILLVSTAGMPMGLQLIREGWLSVDVEQPVSAQAEGIAMFLDDVINGNEIKLGPYEVMSIPAEVIMQPYGLELRISGSVINAENVDDPKFWGNQVGK